MHQNIAVIVWQFNYGKNSFAVLVPERRRCCQLGSHFFYYFFPCPSVFTIFPHPPRRRRRQCTNKSCPMSSAFYSFSLYIYFSLSLSLSLFKLAIIGLFFLYFHLFNLQLTAKQCSMLILPMTGFEPRTSGVGSDRSTNWATTISSLSLSLTFSPQVFLKLCFDHFLLLLDWRTLDKLMQKQDVLKVSTRDSF